jgi:hypothetical protein
MCSGDLEGDPMSSPIAASPVPQEAFERFPGKWIAVRGDTIIASAVSIEELERDSAVQSTDTLVLVPDSATHFYPCHG